MKRLLLFIAVCLLSTITFAQTFTGLGDGSTWHDADNWNPATVPIAGSTVVIPDGFTVNLPNSTGFADSITIQGNSILNIGAQLNLTGPFIIESNATLNWSSLSIAGGGSINNDGTINLTGGVGLNETVLNNGGIINFLSSGDLNVINNSTLNNLPSGVIEMQTDSGNISTQATNGVNVFNNEGMIRRTNSTGDVLINISINNDNGVIQVESGTLSLFGQFDKILTNGTYNVFSGATLEADNGNLIPLNTLQGTIDGIFNIKSNILVNPGTTATFNFTGTGSFNWLQNALEGGGTLINQSTLNLITSATKTIRDNSTLNNEGTIRILSGGDIIIQDGTINNQINGVIDLQADSGNITYPVGVNAPHIFNNYGLLKRSTSNGEVNISALLNNIDGTITVESGILTLGDSFSIGKNLIDGTYNVWSGAAFNWHDNITVSGNLIGAIDGDLNWNDSVTATSSANFNFTGTGDFNWTFGALTGGGTLVNNSILNLTNASKQILGTTTLENFNIINLTSVSNLMITDGFIINFGGALLDLQAENGNITGTQITISPLRNAGTIRRSNSAGVAIISAPTYNSGTIEVLTGELEFSGTNVLEIAESGILTGVGTLDVPSLADYINNGATSPGLSPGIVTVEGNYQSSSSSYLLIEIMG